MTKYKEMAERLRAVTCDPEGNVCINGSDADRAEIQAVLKGLDQIAAQQESAEPVAWVQGIYSGIKFGWTADFPPPSERHNLHLHPDSEKERLLDLLVRTQMVLRLNKMPLEDYFSQPRIVELQGLIDDIDAALNEDRTR